MRSEHKRIKHHQMPGDIGRRYKIMMRERRAPFSIEYGSYRQHITAKCAKAFRKMVAARGRTVQRRRDKQAIQGGLDSGC